MPRLWVRLWLAPAYVDELVGQPDLLDVGALQHNITVTLGHTAVNFLP